MNEILLLLEVLIDEQNLTIRQEDETIAGLVTADRSLIRVAPLNVLHSAVKFSPDGSAIRIAYSREEHEKTPMLQVCTHDSGPGIPTGESRRVLERFFTSRAAGSSPESGAGLGLSIAELIVAAQGGFATCCALLIHPSGEAVLSNAGHCQPYIDGKEIELPGGLPLGIVDGLTYEETTISLPEIAQVVLVSDGVVEARNEGGELYGFERLNHLIAATPTAEQVAKTAVAFGQDDDITVMTLVRLAARRKRLRPLLSSSSVIRIAPIRWNQ